MPPRTRIPRVLSIAGSDSGGGAGIQADLKAFAACGVYGMTAITAITAQNTVGVTAVHHIPPRMIAEQVRAVSDDIGVDAVKIGMLGTVETIEAVARALDWLPPNTPVVVDPVMVAESGAALLESEALAALIDLIRRATVATPNLPEALALTGAEDRSQAGAEDRRQAGAEVRRQAGAEDRRQAGADVQDLARRVHALGPRAVIVTGGHREQATDVFFDGQAMVEIPGERYLSGASHGSGCTHSSVLAARLAWGDEPLGAARTAKLMASHAVRDGLGEIGSGAGPVDVLGLVRARSRF